MTVQPRGRVGPHELVEVSLTVNGAPVTARVSPRMHLADVLRDHLGLTGTHLGCEHGVCGMCTVLVDGVAARACLLFAVQCEGASVVTVEGLGAPGEQHPLQRAFAAHHGLQCGFCTPGMLMSSYDLLANEPAGTDVAPERLPVEMSGVLCRCTGYRGILAAVADVAAAYPDGLPEPANCQPTNRALLGRVGPPTPAAAPPRRVAEQPESSAERPDAVAEPGPEPVRLPEGAPSASVDVRAALSAPVDAVWRVLDDFDQLARCLPGAELLEVLGEDRYRGRAVVALGPVRLSFNGVAQVVERDPDAHRLRVHAQGADPGGSATQADIQLHATPTPDGGTQLSADAALYLSGRIAQFGRALAGDVSRRMFERFAGAVDQAATTGRAPEPGAGPHPLRIMLDALIARFRAVLTRRRRR
jgi:aerobic-type carbon monoxide dehydrogenase small subunit (CoxS/CutS family)/carbon monoxide dehydrogenase subunit G